MQLLDFLENSGCELSIGMEEVENILFDKELMISYPAVADVESEGEQKGSIVLPKNALGCLII